MNDNGTYPGDGPHTAQRPGIDLLAEAALRTLVRYGGRALPESHTEWVGRLCDAALASGDTEHEVVINRLLAGVASRDELLHELIPAVANRLGDMWVGDEASFVDVTIASSRLQSVFRTQDKATRGGWSIGSALDGDSVLMVVPEFEQHSLGVFVAADQFRSKGVWARIALSVTAQEVCEVLDANNFAMLGITMGSRDTVDRMAKFVEYIRHTARDIPPVVVSGNVVERLEIEWSRTGADFVVNSVQEAIDKCALVSATKNVLMEGDA